MKKISLVIFILIFASNAFFPSQVFGAVAKTPAVTAQSLVGKFVLQKDSENKLWYVDPSSKLRYYIKDNQDWLWLVQKFGVKPTTKEFAGLAKNKNSKTSTALAKKYSGKIIISPSSSTTIYFLNPVDKIAYRVNNFSALVATIKAIGPKVDSATLRGLKMNIEQFTYDPAFYGTAQVAYDGNKYYSGKDSDRILPLASLSKVMTALVFLDTNPDWNQVVEITPEQIKYPCTLQLCGTTSEIPLRVGDRLRIKDLWIAMLSASSNQSAKILADNSGLTTAEFVAKMNEKAKELGLSKTKFVEMSGLSADNISTAEEFAKVVEVAFKNDIIASGTRNLDYVFMVAQSDGSLRDVRVQNRNYSLLSFDPIASKSGYLTEAQRNAVVMKDGKVIVVLHAYSLTQRNNIVKNILEGDQLASVR